MLLIVLSVMARKMKGIRSGGMLALVTLIATGCGSDAPSFSLLPDEDIFYQNSENSQSIGKMDILWVIDNSGSMQTSQSSLVANFQSFIQDMATREFDYQIAVTTTEAYKADFLGNDSLSRFRDGVGTSHTGVFIITPDTPNLIDTFVTNALQGTSGSGDERAFHSIEETIENALNSGLIRSNSFLSIIVVSDEDDFSHTSQSHNENYSNPNLYPISHYTDYLDLATSSTPDNRKYSVSAMAIFDEACRQQLNSSWNGRKIGVRYGDLVDATGGVKGSLCDDFSVTLETISDNILSLATKFTLSREPIPDSIGVYINGVATPRVDLNPGPLTGGWYYEAAENAIYFTGDYLPDAGAQIKVGFDPVQFD